MNHPFVRHRTFSLQQIDGQLFTTALVKLRLDPSTAILLVMGIILGGAINISLKHIVRKDALVEDPLAILGLTGQWLVSR